jgi:hypothetical protein
VHLNLSNLGEPIATQPPRPCLLSRSGLTSLAARKSGELINRFITCFLFGFGRLFCLLILKK